MTIVLWNMYGKRFLGRRAIVYFKTKNAGFRGLTGEIIMNYII
jgi:hypothetical protein